MDFKQIELALKLNTEELMKVTKNDTIRITDLLSQRSVLKDMKIEMLENSLKTIQLLFGSQVSWGVYVYNVNYWSIKRCYKVL